MPAHILWDRITRTSQKMRTEMEESNKKWVIEQLNFGRAVTFALQVSGDTPPTWEEVQRQKQKKGPKRDEVQKARRQWEQAYERHMQSLTSPYAWEEAMGLPHFFDKPPPETVKTSKEFRAERKKQVSAMEERILGKLDRFVEKYGDTPIDQVLQNQAQH